VIGTPTTPSLISILEILFPGMEAEIAVRLPLEDKTVSELKNLFPEHSESLGEILDGMARRGTVFSSQSAGEERQYRLLPSLVGWAETPFWAGKDTEDVAIVNEELCIGCGVCTPSCSTGAAALIQREEIKSPPELSEFLAVRFKAQ
jgi:NAD-dependent dihydropyrimidine dehydrogenase PreA subunit